MMGSIRLKTPWKSGRLRYSYVSAKPSNLIRVRPGTTYTYSCYMKSRGWPAHVVLGIAAYDASRRPLGNQPSSPFDAIISRAFASLAAFAAAARHLAGAASLLAMKGRYPERELRELPDWVRVQSVEELRVPGLQAERHLVIMSVNP